MGTVLAEEDIRLEKLHPVAEALPEEQASIVLAEAEKSFLRGYFERVLSKTSGNISMAAEIAGISRKNVYEHLRRVGLDPAAFRRSP
jgi:DNA-binding NtrC family response regulator